MISAWSGTEVRRAEAPLVTDPPQGAGRGAELMDRAAAGLAAVCRAELRRLRGRVHGSDVLVLAGAGNNGGDALLAGAALARRGARVTALILGMHGPDVAVHRRALAEFKAAGGRPRAVAGGTGAFPAPADLVVDGILGTGARGALREPARTVVAALLDRPDGPARRVVACDLPSGVDADTGAVSGPVLPADVTVTMGAVKTGLLLPPGARLAGRVHTVDIGLGPYLGSPELGRLTAADAAGLWPVPGPGDDKYRRGVLGLVAGGEAFTGAAVMAAEAAVRTGVGMVRYAGPEAPTALIRARRPEVVFAPGRVQAWALGSGVDPSDALQLGRCREALASGRPCLVDAGALELVPDAVSGPVLLTPHAGELARLLGRLDGRTVTRAEVEAAPLRWARHAADRTGAVVLLKGSTTLVVAPGGTAGAGPSAYSQADAPSWLATAGAGDVLAGVLGALLAALAARWEREATPAARRPAELARTAALGALAHGRAARLASAGGPIAALDVAEAVPAAVARLLA